MTSRLYTILFGYLSFQSSTEGLIKNHTSSKESDDNFYTSQVWRVMDGRRLINPDYFVPGALYAGQPKPERPRWKDCFLYRLTFDNNEKPYLVNRIEIQGSLSFIDIEERFKNV